MPRTIHNRLAARIGHIMIHKTRLWNKSRKARESAAMMRVMRLSSKIYFK